LQSEASKESAGADADVEALIERIKNSDDFEPFQALVNERS
jgi:hypothetical protein